MRAYINRALARFDLIVIKPSQLASEDEKMRMIVALNQAINQLEDDKMKLSNKVIELSKLNEMPRCDQPFLNHQHEQTAQIKELQVTVQNLRSRVSYWKKKAGK
jgi:hypothetical protein